MLFIRGSEMARTAIDRGDLVDVALQDPAC